MDGAGSATVFNGPTPLLDAMYTSTSNLITGNDVIMMSLLGGPCHLTCRNDVTVGGGAPHHLTCHYQQCHIILVTTRHSFWDMCFQRITY